MRKSFVSLIGIFFICLLASTNIHANTTFDENTTVVKAEAVALTVSSQNFDATNPVTTKVDYGDNSSNLNVNLSSNFLIAGLPKDEPPDIASTSILSAENPKAVHLNNSFTSNLTSKSSDEKTAADLSSGRYIEQTDVGIKDNQIAYNKEKTNQEALASTTKDGLITAGIYIQHSEYRNILFAKKNYKADGLCTNVTINKNTRNNVMLYS